MAVTCEDLDTMPARLKKSLYNMISSKNAYINKNLKTVAEMAGIKKKVSMHIARHTFARIAKLQGIDNALLKNMLGHSKLETTERYMGEFDTLETDRAMAKIFPTKKETQINVLIELLESKSTEELTALIQLLNG